MALLETCLDLWVSGLSLMKSTAYLTQSMTFGTWLYVISLLVMIQGCWGIPKCQAYPTNGSVKQLLELPQDLFRVAVRWYMYLLQVYWLQEGPENWSFDSGKNVHSVCIIEECTYLSIWQYNIKILWSRTPNPAGLFSVDRSCSVNIPPCVADPRI